MLGNLIDNAVAYTPEGGVVDVIATQLGAAPALIVIDDGPGIAASESERVFGRFYRGQATRQSGGDSSSGLGLAIVQAIAERHAARVSLHTPASGRGLEVRVVFGAPAG